MKRYYEVGEVFQDRFDVIKVVEYNFDDSKCNRCEYNQGRTCGTDLMCISYDRCDGKTVIYIKIDELEEGEEFKEENYAK
jgi:hypothetical protein